jgi:hypothetical protein
MHAPLRRGSVVLRAGRYSVVWDLRGADLAVLPLLLPHRPDCADVALDLAELVACGVPVARAVVRPSAMRQEPRRDALHTGDLPDDTIRRLAHGVIRAADDARARSYASCASRHREHVSGERCADLLRA